MKKITTLLSILFITASLFSQNIENKVGTDGEFKVLKNDGSTSLFSLSETGDHMLQLSASKKAFTINNDEGAAIFQLDDSYDIADIAKLKIGHADSDWLPTGKFANIQLQSSITSTTLNMIHIGKDFTEVAGYRATGSPESPANVPSGGAMLALYGFGYNSDNYQFAAGILLSADGTPSTQVPSRIEFLTGKSDAQPTIKMIIKNDGKVGIGAETPNSTLDVEGSVSKSIVDVAGATYTASDSNYTILPQNPGGNVTVTVPNPSTCKGRIYVVKHDGGTTSNIILDPVDEIKIDGNTTFTLDAAWEHVTIQSTGATWVIIGGNH